MSIANWIQNDIRVKSFENVQRNTSILKTSESGRQNVFNILDFYMARFSYVAMNELNLKTTFWATWIDLGFSGGKNIKNPSFNSNFSLIKWLSIFFNFFDLEMSKRYNLLLLVWLYFFETFLTRWRGIHLCIIIMNVFIILYSNMIKYMYTFQRYMGDISKVSLYIILSLRKLTFVGI